MRFDLGQTIIDRIRGKDAKRRLSAESVRKWCAHDGDNTLRVNYDLTPDSMVFDVGGYRGAFAMAIYARYRSMMQTFAHRDKIVVHGFGLSRVNETTRICLQDSGSGVFGAVGGETEEIQLADISEFIRRNNIRRIDLLKINIEGGEYGLLERLLETGEIERVKDLQVQFHRMSPDSPKRMTAIQSQLKKTHELTYQYLWCWENWRLRTDA